MVLAYWKIKESEARLSKHMHTTKEEGTLRSALEDEALKHGLYVYVNESAHIEEIGYFIHRKIPVIVRFIERSDDEDEHYSVVSGYGPKHITLKDPYHGPRIRYTHPDFKAVWKGEGMTAWLMAAAPFDMQFGKQLSPEH